MTETTVSESEKFMTVETNDFSDLRPRLVTLAKEGWSLIGWWERRSMWDKLFVRKGYLTMDFVKIEGRQIVVESNTEYQSGYRRLFRENKRLESDKRKLTDKLGRAQERIRTLENRTDIRGNFIPKTMPIHSPPPRKK